VVWKHLDHPNIVPFKGVTFEPLQLVSEWMPGGELREYIENNPHADLLGLVSLLISSRLQESPHPVLSRSALPKVSVIFTRAT